MIKIWILVLLALGSSVAGAQTPVEFIPGNTPAEVNAGFVATINAHMSSRFVVGIVSRMTPYELYRMRQLYSEAGGNVATLDSLFQTNTIHPNLYTKYKTATAANYNDLVPAVTPINGVTPVLRQNVPMHVRAPNPTLDMTIEEIYLEYRTAPFGSLSVSASLYQTAWYCGRYLVGAYLAGEYVGSQIHSIIEVYAPQVNDDIGGTIDQMIQQLQNAYNLALKGQAADALRAAMGMPPLISAGGTWGYGFVGPSLIMVFTQQSGFIVILPGTSDTPPLKGGK